MKNPKVQICQGWLNGVRCNLVGRKDWKNGQGHGRMPQDRDPMALVEVALDSDWVECVDSLLHEVVELVATDMGFVYGASVAAYHSSTQTRLFVFNHDNYVEVMRRSADFLTMVLTQRRPLERAWCKVNKAAMVKEVKK